MPYLTLILAQEWVVAKLDTGPEVSGAKPDTDVGSELNIFIFFCLRNAPFAFPSAFATSLPASAQISPVGRVYTNVIISFPWSVLLAAFPEHCCLISGAFLSINNDL